MTRTRRLILSIFFFPSAGLACYRMMKLAKTRVLVTGMNGLGAEIAKNVILANVNSVTLHDTEDAAIADLGAHFYLKEEDVGKNRAEACLEELQQLNPVVKTTASSAALEGKFLEQFDAVVCVGTPLEQACEINDFCRAQRPPIAFMYTNAYGLAGAAFSDFGDNFPVADWSGEPMKTKFIAKITQANPAVVNVVFDKNDINSRHDLAEGEMVEFSEVKGMTELNGNVYRVKEVLNPWMFSIECDTTEFGEYFDGGVFTERRPTRYIPFRSMRETLASPGEFLISDFGKWGRWGSLHLALQAVEAYRAEHGSYPAPGDSGAGDEVVAHANRINAAKLADLDAEEARLSAQSKALSAALKAISPAEDEASKEEAPSGAEAAGLAAAIADIDDKLSAVRSRQNVMGYERVDQVDETLMKNIASGSSAVINAMAAFLGGLVGQEVVKAATSKYLPLNQWYHHDALEALPEEPVDPATLAPQGTRYDAMISIFGTELVEKIRSLKYFLVGAGALGCEYLKNFALTGVGSGPEGKVVVTDDDVIERSNLSRQFLFRNWHVKRSKSECASEAAKAMNPEFNIQALQERVSPDTEDIFNDGFWSNLDGVCNALDNIKARLYVDSRCVFYTKSLLESGTLGAKCNTQVVVPHQTEHYGAARDPPEQHAPQCTIHNFPHTIEHCLVWAKSEFTGLFETAPTETSRLLEAGSPEAYVDALRSSGASVGDILNNLRGDKTWGGGIAAIVNEIPQSFDDCVRWARHKWEVYASSMIKLLVSRFPEDATTSEGGRFWTAPKRFPHALEFDLEDDKTEAFLRAASLLRASTYGLTAPSVVDKSVLAAALEGYEEPAFDPNALGDVKIETDTDADPAAAAASQGSDADVTTTIGSFPSVSEFRAAVPTVYAEEFEKDDDSNHHIAFIHALGCLRARAYEIAEVDFLKAKLSAGRIIPAIATATAMAAGCCMFELIKLAQGVPVGDMRNSFFNLGVMAFQCSEPSPPLKDEDRQETVIPDPNYPDYEEERNIVVFPRPAFTVWDIVVIQIGAEGTVGDVVAYFEDKGIDVLSFVVADALVYQSFSKTAAEIRDTKFLDHVLAKVSDDNRPKLEAEIARGFVNVDPMLEKDMAEVHCPTILVTVVDDVSALPRSETTALGQVGGEEAAASSV